MKQDEVIKFEHTFKMKYRPQRSCLLLVNDELKIELILLSIILGFGILLMLLSWLFIWHAQSSYFPLLKTRLLKRKSNSMIVVDQSSIASIIRDPARSELPKISELYPCEELDKLNQIATKKYLEAKRFYKGHLPSLEDTN